MSQHESQSRQARRRPTGSAAALGVSLLAHAAGLGVLFAFARSGTPAISAEVAPVPSWPVSLLPAAPATEPIADVEIRELPLLDDPSAVVRPWDARPGERDNPVPVTTAPADADGRQRRAPAPDRGILGGAPPDRAFRLDRSRLRARLTDGASEAQPADSRTARRQASPQAVRREPVVGLGDSPRNALPSRAPTPAPESAGAPALGGEPAAAALEARRPVPPAATVPVVARVDAKPSAAHAEGPLDADRGPQRFDVQIPGRAADDYALRAASNEIHPGLIDYTRAAAPAPAPAAGGRGPGETAGAVARPTTGAAAVEYGARDPRGTSQNVSERTLDRRYNHYIQEISQRVNRIRDFPKALALRLEQGETIVEFVVAVDGRLGDGPRVVKTSGFEEFDAAAMRAVRRAAPFPPMPNPAAARPLPVNLRVTFDNPVVR